MSSEEEWRQSYSEENLTKPAELKLTFVASSAHVVDLKGHVAIYINESKTKEMTDYIKELLEQQAEEEREEKEEKEREEKEKEENKEGSA